MGLIQNFQETEQLTVALEKEVLKIEVILFFILLVVAIVRVWELSQINWCFLVLLKSFLFNILAI